MAERNLFVSNKQPVSKVLNSTFINRLNSLFGFRTVSKDKAQTSFEKNYGLKFVRVDLNNTAYRIENSSLGSFYNSTNFNTTLEKYFDAYLNETTLSYSDIVERMARINELSFFYYNDPFGGRVVNLVADEATQLDVQDRLITIQSPNKNFTKRVYELLSYWGVTQSRVHGVCHDIELYGESFWAHKISMNGIEKIIPLKVEQIKERLEFSPTHMAQYLAQKNPTSLMKDRKSKIAMLVDMLNDSSKSYDYAENLSDLFDTKILGYELEDGIIAPPWSITHFRYNADHSEFYPYGRPPLLNCLAPFKQTSAAMALQGLARQMSLPVTLYKVKTSEGMAPERAFEHVNTVREEYDNIGVSPTTVGTEVYTVNTKIWAPDGLLDVQVIDSKCDINFIEDIELYQDRVAWASGVPKAYLDQEFGGFGSSGISLMEQYKPFGRHVYTVQSTFIQGLGELIRLHFAITSEFDYNTPFIISMRFPAEESSSEKDERRKASLEMTQSIIDLITNVLGIEEGQPLPQDVVVDIMNKYSFIDPTDIKNWLTKSAVVALQMDDEEGSEGDSDYESEDFGGDFDLGGDDAGMDDSEGLADSIEESIKTKKRHLKNHINYKQRSRMREIKQLYKESADDIFFHFLEENNLTEFKNYADSSHKMLVAPIRDNSLLYESICVLRNDTSMVKKRLTEDADLSLNDYLSKEDVIGASIREEVSNLLERGTI